MVTIPAISELAQRNQWVLWRVEKRNGKDTKVPYQPNGKHAKSNDTATWSSYEAVKAAYDKAPEQWSGIGYVFAEDDPYTGVDLDDCITDGAVEMWAQLIIDQLASYTEVSPSGNGVKIFVEGQIPHSVKLEGEQVPESIKPSGISGGIEMYNKTRYFTVTGQHLQGTPDTIASPNGTLTSLYQQTQVREQQQQQKDVPEDERVKAALAALNSSRWDNYRQWVALGHMLKHWNGTGARDLWEQHTRRSSKYQDDDCDKWETFKPIRYRTENMCHSRCRSFARMRKLIASGRGNPSLSR